MMTDEKQTAYAAITQKAQAVAALLGAHSCKPSFEYHGHERICFTVQMLPDDKDCILLLEWGGYLKAGRITISGNGYIHTSSGDGVSARDVGASRREITVSDTKTAQQIFADCSKRLMNDWIPEYRKLRALANARLERDAIRAGLAERFKPLARANGVHHAQISGTDSVELRGYFTLDQAVKIAAVLGVTIA